MRTVCWLRSRSHRTGGEAVTLVLAMTEARVTVWRSHALRGLRPQHHSLAGILRRYVQVTMAGPGRPGTWSYDDPPPVIPRRIAARASLHCAISSPSFADIPRPPAAARSVALQGTHEQPPGRPRAAQRRPAGRCERDRDRRGQYLRGPPGDAEAANASLLPTPRRQLGRTAACYLSRISDF